MEPGAITQLVAAAFTELGAGGDPQSLVRTVLVRNGYFVGYRFCRGGVRADWLAAQGAIELSDVDGKRLRRIDPTEPLKKAAA
jgi:hypothetical protein